MSVPPTIVAAIAGQSPDLPPAPKPSAPSEPKPLEVFYLALEPGIEALFGYWRDRGLDIPKNLHWASVKAPGASFTEMIQAATMVNSMSLESLSKMQDPNRMKHNEFIELLKVLNNFPDERTGQTFGPVDSWGPDRVLVVDSFTGVNRAAMSLVIGAKPVKSQSDWGIAQDTVEKLLRMLTSQCRCHFVFLAHVERETDVVLGGSKVTVSTLGKALAPKIPPMFSDVVLSVREGTKFTWDTASAQADLKTRNLPIASGQSPTFQQVVDKWKSRRTADPNMPGFNVLLMGPGGTGKTHSIGTLVEAKL